MLLLWRLVPDPIGSARSRMGTRMPRLPKETLGSRTGTVQAGHKEAAYESRRGQGTQQEKIQFLQYMSRMRKKYTNGQKRGGTPGTAVDSGLSGRRKDYHRQAVMFHGGEMALDRWVENGRRGY